MILNHEFYLLNEDVEFLSSNNKKTKIINLIVYIYSKYDKEFLMKLIQSNNGKIYCREIFYLLYNEKLEYIDLIFNDGELNQFQKHLLETSDTKKDIDTIIKLSNGFSKSLKFIQENYESICKKLPNNYLLTIRAETFVTLGKIDEKETIDIDEIYNILNDIEKQIRFGMRRLVDFENIFENILEHYSNKDLNELSKLNILVPLLRKSGVRYKLMEEFYLILHKKGINLIENRQLKTKDIIKFVTSQDIFYFSPRYKNSEKRDPIVFKYIPITNIDKEYLNNIQLIKDNRLYELFIDSPNDLRKKFYNILLSQMKKIQISKVFFIFFL